jgi:hypothetical protein
MVLLHGDSPFFFSIIEAQTHFNEEIGFIPVGENGDMWITRPCATF